MTIGAAATAHIVSIVLDGDISSCLLVMSEKRTVRGRLLTGQTLLPLLVYLLVDECRLRLGLRLQQKINLDMN